MIVAIMGTGLENVMVAVGVVSIPAYARLVRGQVLVIKALPFVEAARALGQGQARILARHVLPNTLSPISSSRPSSSPPPSCGRPASASWAWGPRPRRPEWGALVATGEDVPPQRPPPRSSSRALVISLTVMALSLFGDALRDALDPPERIREAT